MKNHPIHALLTRRFPTLLAAVAALAAGAIAPDLQAAIKVTPLYSSLPADGFNSTVVTNHPVHGSIELGVMRRRVFQAAADYVGSLFDPSYPGEEIRVSITMTTLKPGTLGTGGASESRKGFGSTNPKYNPIISYPAALANHLAASNLIAGAHAQVEVSVDQDWDYAINTTPLKGFESFYTTIVHEICHGIGFLDGNDGTGAYGPDPMAFDAYVVSDATAKTPLVGMSEADRKTALTAGNLYFAGPMAMKWNPLQPNQPPKVYAPSPYSSSSSVSHWDPAVWNPFGLLLLPSAAPGVAEKLYLIAMERGVLYDMGYTPARPRLTLKVENQTNYISFASVIGAHYLLKFTTDPSASVKTWTEIGTTNAVTNVVTFIDPPHNDVLRDYEVEEVADVLSAIQAPSTGVSLQSVEKPRKIR